MEQTLTHSSSSKRISNAQLAMLIAIASFAMLFGTLLLSYLFVRARQGVWPPIGVEPLDKRLSTLSTLAVTLSSVMLHFSVKAFAKAEWNLFKNYWNAGSFLGVLFMAMQSVFVWQMWQTGLRVQDGLFQSVSYMLIIVHMIHVFVAWIPLVWVSRKAHKGLYTQPAAEGPLLVSWFWHFLGGVWWITYLLLIWI